MKEKILTGFPLTDIDAGQVDIFLSSLTFTHQQIISKCLAKIKKIKLAHEGTCCRPNKLLKLQLLDKAVHHSVILMDM